MVLRVLGFAAVALGLWLAVQDPALGGTVFGFLLVVGIGGGVGALVAILRNRRAHQAPLTVPDAFARNESVSIINVSQVRVAGLGGLGLVIVAGAIALAYPRIGVSIGLGLVGGFLIALALIPYRRAHAGQRT
jgi:hypothetical protein